MAAEEWRCLSTQSGQRVWPSTLDLPQSRQRPRDARSALNNACLCRCFSLYASLRTLLGCRPAPWLACSATSFRTTSISYESSVRGRGPIPLALRVFSPFCRFHPRCLSAQSRQRLCPLLALFGQLLQRPNSLRRWKWSAARSRCRSLICSSVSRGLRGLTVVFFCTGRLGLLGLVLFGPGGYLCFLLVGRVYWKSSFKSCVLA